MFLLVLPEQLHNTSAKILERELGVMVGVTVFVGLTVGVKVTDGVIEEVIVTDGVILNVGVCVFVTL
jgi:hypothetical protein